MQTWTKINAHTLGSHTASLSDFFDITDFVDLVVSGNSNAIFGVSLLLLGESDLPARAREVR
jgi:hypothetical protein